MAIIALLLAPLALWLDFFFIEGLSLPVRVSFSFVVILLLIVFRREQAALVFALLAGFFGDLLLPATPFGVLLIWNTALWFAVRGLVASFFSLNKPSSLGLLFFLSALIYVVPLRLFAFLTYNGQEGLLADAKILLDIGYLLGSALASTVVAIVAWMAIRRIANATRQWFLVR